jgi:hypothetical protein
MKKKIKINKAQCLICKDVLESKSVHDFKTCSCGNLSVDGGLDYLRRCYIDVNKVKELSKSNEKTS